jgi:hypothetical protein
MGLAQVGVDAVAGASAFPNQGRKASGCDGDAYASGVGDTSAGLLISADGSFCLGNTADGDGLALPAIKTKDAVCFCDQLPTLQVADPAAALFSLLHLGAIKGGGQRADLLPAETSSRAACVLRGDGSAGVRSTQQRQSGSLRASALAGAGCWTLKGGGGHGLWPHPVPCCQPLG